MTLLVNAAPDRHGVIPALEQKRLREMGAWLARTGDAIYGTRGGPWQPVDRQYGFCWKGSTVYVHLLKGYPADSFKLPKLRNLHIKSAYDVFSGRQLLFEGDGEVLIRGINRTESPADSIVAVVYDRELQSIWKPTSQPATQPGSVKDAVNPGL